MGTQAQAGDRHGQSGSGQAAGPAAPADVGEVLAGLNAAGRA